MNERIMAKKQLPDISDLLKQYREIPTEEQIEKRREDLTQKICQAYKKAGVTEKNCDHPYPLRRINNASMEYCNYCLDLTDPEHKNLNLRRKR